MNMKKEAQHENFEQQRKGRLMVLVMLIFFLTPMVVVLVMYKLDWRPQGESLGELVVPARLLELPSGLSKSDGVAVPAQFWREKWSMVYVTHACELACKNKLHTMRQLHVSLYKDIPRMQRVLLTTSTDTAVLLQRYPDLVILNQPASAVQALETQFNQQSEQASETDRLYLVDPLGHLMMSYPATIAPASIRKDIVRLMKFAWAG